MHKSALTLLCTLPLCSCWAPSTFWRVVCISGTPNSSKWSTSVSFFNDTKCQYAVQHVRQSFTSSSEACTKWRCWATTDFEDDDRNNRRCHKDPRDLCECLGTDQVCVRYEGALSDVVGGRSAISMTSDRGSQSPASAWVGIELSKPSEVRCVQFLQHKESLCPVVALQSSDHWSWSWWNEDGWVRIRNTIRDDVVIGFIGQQLDRDEAEYYNLDDHGVAYDHSYQLPATSSSWFGWNFLYPVAIVLVTSVLLQCLISIIILLSLDIWYECEMVNGTTPIVQGTKVTDTKFYPMTFTAQGRASIALSSDKLARIKLVCYPRWLLAGNSLTDFISRSTSELEVLPPEEAQSAFPCGPLRDFEAVVRIPRSMSMEELGRILQALVEKRRKDIGEQPLTARLRLPRFQVIATIGGCFLHFGGSLGCGHHRWRSCPARMFSDRRLSLSVAW